MKRIWIALALGAAAACVAADEIEHHGVHEHGKVTLNIALDGEMLVISLEAPAVNMVGFEHPPEKPQEREILRKTDAMLKSGRGLFGVPQAATCKLASADVEIPDWNDHKHKDYHATFTYRCGNPEQLGWVEAWVFGKLKGVGTMHVNVNTEARQATDVVTSADERVLLQ